MKSRIVVVLLIVFFIVGPVSAQDRFMDYSQVRLLRWMGSEPPDTYAEYLASHPTRPLEIVPVRMAPLRAPLADGEPRVLVIANSTLLPLIETNVNRYISDLEAAGYAADLYSSTYGTAEDLKAFIISIPFPSFSFISRQNSGDSSPCSCITANPHFFVILLISLNSGFENKPTFFT